MTDLVHLSGQAIGVGTPGFLAWLMYSLRIDFGASRPIVRIVLTVLLMLFCTIYAAALLGTAWNILHV
jgi:hypothetical protein